MYYERSYYMAKRMTIGGIVLGLRRAHTPLSAPAIKAWIDKGWIECSWDGRGWRFFPDGDATIKRIQEILNGTIKPDKETKDDN